MARKQKTLKQIFSNGLFKQNPVFVQFLGICPTLAVTGNIENALGMGVGVLFVLVFANLAVSAIRNYVPREVRIPIFIVIIASLVTVLEMLMKAYAPDLAKSLGVFLSLIVVNCLILGRAEAFASKNSPVKSMVDGVSMALGFTGGIVIIAAIRELFGSGSLLGFAIIPSDFQISILVQSAGAFLVFGLVVSQINRYRMNKADREEVA